MDLVPNLIIFVCYATIINTNYQKFDAFPDLVLMFVLSSLCYQSLGYIIATVLDTSPLIGAMIIFATIDLFSGSTPPDWAFSKISKTVLDIICPLRHVFKHIMVLFYGSHRCKEDEISSVMYQFLLTDDDFDESTHLLIVLVIFYFILSYICFKVKVNWDSIHLRIINWKARMTMLLCETSQ